MAVLLIGDSHLARFHEYPWLIARDCVVRAVAGASATDLDAQMSDLDPAEFDVIAVSVGTNDCGQKPTELATYRAALEDLVARVAPTPVLMVNNPGADRRAPDYDDAQMKAYSEVAGDVVRRSGGAVLDIPRVIAPLGQLARTADGVHVSKFGHLAFVPALRRAMRRLAQRP